jgi:predicted nucleic acid-binding Zn ribbon protein
MLRQSCYNNDDSERVFLCAEECRRILEVGKKVKRVKRVMVDVISLAKMLHYTSRKNFNSNNYKTL